MIEAHDRGFSLGDGLFETVLARAGQLIQLDAHLDRMIGGCAVLGLPPPNRGAAVAATRDALELAGLGTERAAVRLSWTAGPGGRGLDRPQPPAPVMVVTAAPAPAPSGPLRLVTSQVRRNARSPASGLKSLAYLDNVLARREARAAGADEALMLDTDDRLSCAAAANLFWVAAGRLHTPSLACGVLPGIVRAQVIAAAAAWRIPVSEAVAAPPELRSAEGIFLTNSLIGLRPVAELDGRSCPQSRITDLLAADIDQS